LRPDDEIAVKLDDTASARADEAKYIPKTESSETGEI
jgi:hypothetical protein